MMVSRKNVFEAADLIALKFQPTVSRVREYLGGGSYAAIHLYLTEWWGAQPDVSDEAESMAKLTCSPDEG